MAFFTLGHKNKNSPQGPHGNTGWYEWGGDKGPVEPETSGTQRRQRASNFPAFHYLLSGPSAFTHLGLCHAFPAKGGLGSVSCSTQSIGAGHFEHLPWLPALCRALTQGLSSYRGQLLPRCGVTNSSFPAATLGSHCCLLQLQGCTGHSRNESGRRWCWRPLKKPNDHLPCVSA